MPDISCATWDTEEDYKMAEEWDRTHAGDPIDPEMMKEIEALMPEVERVIEERFDQMMEEKNVEFVERAEAIIEKDEISLPERVPAETPEEKELMKEVTEELAEKVEKAEQELKNLQPLKTMPEERKAIIEAGKELGLPPRIYVNTADIVRFPQKNVKEVMSILNHPEMPRIFTRRESIGQVQYVDRPDLYQLTRKGAMATPNGIFVLPDEKGQVPTGKLLLGRLSHDIVHPNWPLIKEYIQEHKDEFDKATAVQLEQKGLPSYPESELFSITERRMEAKKGKPLTEEEKAYIKERLQKETVGEFNKYYFTDRSELVPKAQRFMKEMLRYFREKY